MRVLSYSIEGMTIHQRAVVDFMASTTIADAVDGAGYPEVDPWPTGPAKCAIILADGLCEALAEWEARHA